MTIEDFTLGQWIRKPIYCRDLLHFYVYSLSDVSYEVIFFALVLKQLRFSVLLSFPQPHCYCNNVSWTHWHLKRLLNTWENFLSLKTSSNASQAVIYSTFMVQSAIGSVDATLRLLIEIYIKRSDICFRNFQKHFPFRNKTSYNLIFIVFYLGRKTGESDFFFLGKCIV